MSVVIKRLPAVRLEVYDDEDHVATVEIDASGDVEIGADSVMARECAKALAAAIVQACEEYEREVKP